MYTTQSESNQSHETNQSHKPKQFWTQEQDNLLKEAIGKVGTRWIKVASLIQGRNPSQCAQRWKRIKPSQDRKRTKWTTKDDKLVLKLVRKIGKKWQQIGEQFTPNRTGRQIRERFVNQIHPDIDRRPWTQQEDNFIWTSFITSGPMWALIANEMQGRTGNMVKNRFNLYIRTHYGKQQNPYYVVPQEFEKQPETLNSTDPSVLALSFDGCTTPYEYEYENEELQSNFIDYYQDSEIQLFL